MSDRITPEVRPFEVLITDLHNIYLLKTFEMIDTRSNMKLYYLNYKPNGFKSIRDIIYRAVVVCFFLWQGQNITNSFSLTGFMDPLTSMITIAISIRIKSLGLYYLIYHTCAGKWRMKLFSTDTYTQLNYMQKYRVFV